MNVWEKNKRSWRKAHKRAVSPIIATILLVAITVVLAAVLYVLISGLTHGPGNTPIGSAFTAGNPTAATKCTAANVPVEGCVAAGDYVYQVTIESSTVTFASVVFEVKASTGSVFAATTDAGVSVITTSSTVAASWTVTAASTPLAMPSSGWTTFGAGISGTTPLTNFYTIVVDVGSVNPSGVGLTFNGIGAGSYSGTTSPLPLP